MALVNDAGFLGLMRDMPMTDGQAPNFGTTLLMDADTEKVAFVGEVWHPTARTGTINIRKVHFRLGAVTFNILSTFRVSLQSLSLTAGPPLQPDGTQDQTADMTSLTANVFNVTGNLSADRVVDMSADSIGDSNSRWLAVVFEYATFTALDSIVVSQSQTFTYHVGSGGFALLNTGSWALSAGIPIVILECDDGSFAFLRNGIPFSAFSTASVASNGAIRRAGLIFSVPTQRKLGVMSLMAQIPNGCDGTWKLYDSDGSTELVSVNVDNDAISSAGISRVFDVEFEPVTLAASTNYRWVFVAGTTTAALIYYGDVGAAGHLDGMLLGSNAHWTQHDGTSWSQTTTRRPHFGIGYAAFSDGAGAGGNANILRGSVVA